MVFVFVAKRLVKNYTVLKFNVCSCYFDFSVYIINTKKSFDIKQDYCKAKNHFYTYVTIDSYTQVCYDCASFLLRSKRFDQKTLNEILNKGCNNVYRDSTYSRLETQKEIVIKILTCILN